MQKHFQLITLMKKQIKKNLKFSMPRVVALGKGLVQWNTMQEKPLRALEYDSETMKYCFQCKLTPAAPSLYAVDTGETGGVFRITPVGRTSQRNHSKE